MQIAIRYFPSAAFYVLALAAQVSGYTSPTVAIVLAGVATLMLLVPACYHTHGWHKRRLAAGNRGLEPIYVIAFGLVIALGGVVWQWSRSSASDDSKVALLQSQLATAASELAEARKHKDGLQIDPATGQYPDIIRDETNRRLAILKRLQDKYIENNPGALPLTKPKPVIDWINQQLSTEKEAWHIVAIPLQPIPSAQGKTTLFNFTDGNGLSMKNVTMDLKNLENYQIINGERAKDIDIDTLKLRETDGRKK